MFLIDDILLSPFKGLLWIFREVHNAAEQELSSEEQSITNELSELYRMLETGQISEPEFDSREKQFLDRLEKINDHGTLIEEEAERV